MLKRRRKLVAICLSAVLCFVLYLEYENRWGLDLTTNLSLFESKKNVRIEPVLYTKSRIFQEQQAEKFRDARLSISLLLDSKLTETENISVTDCVQTGARKARKSMRLVDKARLKLDFLTNTSVVVDVGGNIGSDAMKIVSRYKPLKYIILEPLEPYFLILLQQFQQTEQVDVINVGLAATDGVFYSAVAGEHGDSTSIFRAADGGHLLKMENATRFFMKLGVGEFDCDLMTVNCEGCEYDVLESLIASNMIRHFKHIQFRTNTTLDYLEKPVYRHCRIQQLLKRSFVPNFLYGSLWEAWERVIQ